MFKRLRERIAEEATKFPGGQLNNNNNNNSTTGERVTTTEDLITLSDSSAVLVPSAQQFSIGDDDEQQTTKTDPPATGVDSDLGLYRPSGMHGVVVPSDIESEREDPPTLNLEGISKEQLTTVIHTLKARCCKYKNKYKEVVNNFKELQEEKAKIETTLIENQDKGLRRILELREQCQLEQRAKAHLEENLRLLIEEKDSRISVLVTQINLLREGRSNDGDESLEKRDFGLQFSSGHTKSEDSSAEDSDVSLLSEKLERLEHQGNQDRKNLSAQKEQIVLLHRQNEALHAELTGTTERARTAEERCSERESMLESLRRQEEESLMSMAETKKNMHAELESKEKRLLKVEEEHRQMQAALDHERSLCAELRKSHEMESGELRNRLLSTERLLEEEKHNLVQELARAKSAALALMQEEYEKKMHAMEDECTRRGEEAKREFRLEIEDLSAKLWEADGRHSELCERLKEAAEHNSSLTGAIEALESARPDLRSVGQQTEEELHLASKDAEIARLGSEIDSLKIQLRENVSTAAEMSERLEDTENRLSRTVQECASKEASVSTARESEAALATQISVLSERLREAEEERASLESQFEESVSAEEGGRHQISVLSERLRETEDRLARAEEERASRQREGEEEIRVLRERLEDTEDRLCRTTESRERDLLEADCVASERLKEAETRLALTREESASRERQLRDEVEALRSDGARERLAEAESRLSASKAALESQRDALEEEMNSKLKGALRDFSERMNDQSKDHEQTVSELIEKNRHLEEMLRREHHLEMVSLRQELFEKECALDEMRDRYEEALGEKDPPAVVNNNASDWDDTWVVPDEVCESSSVPASLQAPKPCEEHQLRIRSMEEELERCNSEIKDLRVLLRLSPPAVVANSSSSSNHHYPNDSLALPEPTEFEYLKNIVYEYMMGKEPATLAKVIAAVLKFNELQTQQIIHREETKYPKK